MGGKLEDKRISYNEGKNQEENDSAQFLPKPIDKFSHRVSDGSSGATHQMPGILRLSHNFWERFPQQHPYNPSFQDWKGCLGYKQVLDTSPLSPIALQTSVSRARSITNISIVSMIPIPLVRREMPDMDL
jgi:hypothetical protein